MTAVGPPFNSRVDHALAMAERRIPTPSRYAAEWALDVLAVEVRRLSEAESG